MALPMPSLLSHLLRTQPCIVSGFSPKAWAQCLIKLPCFIFSASARPQYGSSGLSLIFAPFVVCSSSARSTPTLWSVSRLQEECFTNLQATLDSRLGGQAILAPASSQEYRQEWAVALKLSRILILLA